MTISKRWLAAALATVAVGLAACGGDDDSGAASTTAVTAPVDSTLPTTSRAGPTSTAAPSTTQAPTTTGTPTTQAATTQAPAAPAAAPTAVVPLLPTATCPSEGASSSAPGSGAPLVCVEHVGSLVWAAVVQGDLGDEARQALSGCADELTAIITSIGPGDDVVLPQCDAATSAVASSGNQPYMALIQKQLAECRLPLAQYSAEQQQGVTYDAPKAEALVNQMFACRAVIAGFATTTA